MIVDSIEANVESAAVGVEQGTEQLRQARQHQVILTVLWHVLHMVKVMRKLPSLLQFKWSLTAFYLF